MTDDIEIYYRVKMTPAEGAVVCCLQWFDEGDYAPSEWVTDTEGVPVKLERERDAQDIADALNRATKNRGLA